MKRKCPKCDADLYDGSDFCPECGCYVKKTSTPVIAVVAVVGFLVFCVFAYTVYDKNTLSDAERQAIFEETGMDEVEKTTAEIQETLDSYENEKITVQESYDSSYEDKLATKWDEIIAKEEISEQDMEYLNNIYYYFADKGEEYKQVLDDILAQRGISLPAQEYSY